MSYSNPQRIINKEFAEAAKGASNIQRSLDNTSANISNIVKKQKIETAKIIENNTIKESQLRDKINEFSTPGAGNMDNTIVKFWDPYVEDYVNNMNMAANGEITQREAMIRNKSIEALLPQFKSNTASIGLEGARLKADVNNGTVSTTGSVSSKIVLDRINNNGDVQIVEQNGAIYYWAPDRDDDGEIIGEFDPKNSNFINGSKLYANPDKSLFNNKTDISGLITKGYATFGQEDTGISEYYKDVAVKNGDIDPRDPEGIKLISGMEDGYEQLIRMPSKDPDAKTNFMGEVESSAYLNPITSNEKEMQSVWQDELPDGEIGDDGQYPPNTLGFYASGGDPTLNINLEEMGYVGENAMEEWQNSVYGEYPSDASPEQQSLIDKNQKAVSKRYMANLMWDQNAITVPQTLKGKRKIPEETTPSTSSNNQSSRFTKGQQTVYDMRKDDYVANRNSANEMYDNGTPDAQTFMTQLQESAPEKYKDVFINDKGLIQSGNSIINIPTSAKAANIIFNSDSGIDRNMQNIFEKENPYSVEEEEEVVNVNQTGQPPKGSTVYRSSANEKKTFNGVLTEDEIMVFNESYPDEIFTDGSNPLFNNELEKISQNPPDGMSRAAYKQSPEAVQKALRISKRKQAVKDKAEDSNYYAKD